MGRSFKDCSHGQEGTPAQAPKAPRSRSANRNDARGVGAGDTPDAAKPVEETSPRFHERERIVQRADGIGHDATAYFDGMMLGAALAIRTLVQTSPEAKEKLLEIGELFNPGTETYQEFVRAMPDDSLRLGFLHLMTVAVDDVDTINEIFARWTGDRR